MPGPLPKAPGLRQRRNKVSTRSLLPSTAESRKRKVPALPKRDSPTENWHPKVVEWWKSVWQSPMGAEFLDADMRGGLYVLAELKQQWYTATDIKQLVMLSSEIRQQEVRFGLSPIDRRRLQWEIEKGEQAQERTTRRRQRDTDDKKRDGKDPREFMRVHPGGKS